MGAEDVRTSWGVEGKEVTGLGRGLGQPLFGSAGALWCPALEAELPQLPQGVTKRPVSRVGVGERKSMNFLEFVLKKTASLGHVPLNEQILI